AKGGRTLATACRSCRKTVGERRVGMRRCFLRLLNAFRPGRSESELERELSSHLALLEDDFRSRGLSEEEAGRAAMLALGGVEQTKELHRESGSFGWVEDLKRDVRYAMRTLAKSPGFTVAVVLILAVGIGQIRPCSA